MSPLGTGAGDFFTPVHGRYAAQLISIKDGKPQTYAAEGDRPARTAIPAVWALRMFNVDGTPVLDPKKPGTQAVWEVMSSQTTGYGNDGRPAKAREYLTAFLASNGIVFPDENTEDQLGQYVALAIDAYAYVTVGENPMRTQKTRTIIRSIEPLIQVAAAPPLPAPAAFAAAALPVAEAVAAAPTALPVQAPFVPVVPAAAEAAVPAGIPAMPFGQAPA
jgi:hypothetical protein